MGESFRAKLHSGRGMTRAAALLLVLVAVMLCVVSVPVYRAYKYHADYLACLAALDSAQRRVAVDFVAGDDGDAEDAKQTITAAMLGWDDLCPAGGNCYIVERDDEVHWHVVCGLHDDDAAERTRLNASYTLDNLREALREARSAGEPAPESVSLALNGRELIAQRVDADAGLRRGTSTTKGQEGTVAYFMTDGEGEVIYFGFADEDYCANWRVKDGWTGDSYGLYSR